MRLPRFIILTFCGLLLPAAPLAAQINLSWEDIPLIPIPPPVPIGATLTISTADNHNFDGMTLVNNGTVNWSNGDLRSGNGGSFTNNGTFNDTTSSRQLNNAYNGTMSTVHNTGTWIRNGTGSTLFHVPFTSSGVLTLQAGDIEVIAGGALQDGSSTTAGSGTVFYFHGNYAIHGGATLLGAGLFQLYSGTLTVAGNLTAPHFLQTSGLLAGTPVITGGYEWRDGSWNSGGTTTVGSTGVLGITTGANHDYDATTVVNAGTVNWSDGNLRSGNGGSFTNNGTFNDTTSSRQFNNAYNGTMSVVTNTGSWNRNGSGSTKFYVPFTSSGQVNLLGGDIEVLAGGSLQNGSTTTAGSGTVFYFNGNYAVSAGATLAGAGLFQLYSGTLTVGGNLTAPNFLQTSGLLAGSPNITGTYEWRDGSWSSGGTTTVGSTGVLGITTGANHDYDATTVVNAGTVNWSDGNLRSGNGGSFTNNGTFNDTTSSRQFNNAYNGTMSVVTNTGSWNRNGSGSTKFYVPFTSSGQVSLQGGDIEVLAGGALQSGSTTTAGTGTVFYFNGDYGVNAGATLAGAGLFQLHSGTLTVGGNLTAPHLLQTSGLLAGTPTITGNYEWRDGSWSSGGTTTIGAVGVLAITSGADHNYDATAIVNQGTVNWSDGNLRSGNGGSFLNAGLFNDNSSNRQFNNAYNGTTATFTNNHTYLKNAAGTTTFFVPFINNNGHVKVNAGTLRFAGGFTQNSGTLELADNAAFQFDSGLGLAAGYLLGNGTIHGNVTSEGFISPGQVLGRLDIVGNLALQPNGFVLFDLGGTGQGTTYDFLNVSGTASFDGALFVGFANGFQSSIAFTDTFTVLQASSLSGTFSNLTAGNLVSTHDGLGSFQVLFNSGSLQLTGFTPIPEPSTWMMLAGGLTALGWRLRRKLLGPFRRG